MANPVMHFELMVNGDLDAVRRFYAEAFAWTIDASGGRTRMTSRALHRSVADRVKHSKMGFHDGWGQSFERFAAAAARRR